MNRFPIAVLSLLAFFGIDARAEEAVSVNSTSGTVLVTPEELKKAYVSLVERKSNHAESISVNEDGSVAIVRPYFQYNDQNLRIDFNYDVARGVCKRFGFEKFVGREYELIRGDVYVAILNDKAQLRDLASPKDYPEREKHPVLKSVACRE